MLDVARPQRDPISDCFNPAACRSRMRDAHVLMRENLRDSVTEKQRHLVTEFRLNLSMEYNSLGKRLRERRKELGFTLDQVAKGSGMGTGTVSDIEQGRQKGSTKLHKIAAFLRVRVEWLESGDGTKENNGVAQPHSPPHIGNHAVHGIFISRDGAEVGAEWDKIEGDEYKQLARDFIYGIVAAQKRASRVEQRKLSTREKPQKSRARGAQFE